MKRTYIIFLVLLSGLTTFAQIGSNYWQMLPQDYKTKPYVRDTIVILKVSDSFIDDVSSLNDMWDFLTSGVVENVDIVSFDSISADDDANFKDAADLTAHAISFYNSDFLMVLFKVEDDDVEARDRVTTATAPYTGKYQPSKPIYPAGFCPSWVGNKTPDPYDYEFGDRKIPGDEYVDMSKYSMWTEAGAFKADWNLSTSGANGVYPATDIYDLIGPSKDTLGNAIGGSIPEKCFSVFETKTDGYYFLTMLPWTMFKGQFAGKIPQKGTFESMSIGFQITDQDEDHKDGTDGDEDIDPTKKVGATTEGDVYWAIAYYGAVGKFSFQTITVDVKEKELQKIHAYVSYDNLMVRNAENIQTLKMYSVSGAEVLSVRKPASQLSLAAMPKGLYIVKMTDLRGQTFVQKIAR